MHILYINDFAAPFQGSFIRSLLAISEEIVKNNNSVSYIFPIRTDYTEKLSSKGIVYYCESFLNKKFDLKLLFLVIKICKTKKITIIHSNFGLAGHFVGTVVSIFFRIKHISHERSISKSINKRNLRTYFVKQVFRFFDFFSNNSYIAISQEVKNSLIKHNGYDVSKIQVLNNAVTISNENAEKPKYNFTGPVICMLAHMGYQKDHLTLINAAEIVLNQFPDAKFLLIGDDLVHTKESYRKKYEEIISFKKLQHAFLFTGMLTNPYYYLEMISIGCLISRNEGFGNAVVEYMLHRKPVIATSVGGLKDIVIDGVTGFLIEPGNYHQLATKINLLISDETFARKMGDNGYKRASEKFNMNNWANYIYSTYQKYSNCNI